MCKINRLIDLYEVNSIFDTNFMEIISWFLVENAADYVESPTGISYDGLIAGLKSRIKWANFGLQCSPRK